MCDDIRIHGVDGDVDLSAEDFIAKVEQALDNFGNGKMLFHELVNEVGELAATCATLGADRLPASTDYFNSLAVARARRVQQRPKTRQEQLDNLRAAGFDVRGPVTARNITEVLGADVMIVDLADLPPLES